MSLVNCSHLLTSFVEVGASWSMAVTCQGSPSSKGRSSLGSAKTI